MTKTKLAAALALAALAVTTSYIATSSSPTLDAMSENPASSKQDGAYSRTASETTPLTAANHSATPPILQRHFDELKDKAQRGRRQAPDPDSWMAAELSQAQKEEPGVKKFYAQFHGSVKAGETLLTGGWETTPGTHTFALIRTFSMANDREDVANIEAKLFSVKTSGAQNGAAFLVDQAAFDPNSGQSHLAGVLSDDQIKLLMDTAERSNGTEVLAAPRISSNLGGAAEMRVGNVVPNSIDGGNHFLGTKVSILPIARNGEALEFSTVVLISQLAQ